MSVVFYRVSIGGKERERREITRRGISALRIKCACCVTSAAAAAARKYQKQNPARINTLPSRGNLSERQRSSVHVRWHDRWSGSVSRMQEKEYLIGEARHVSRIRPVSPLSALFALVTVSLFLSSFLPCTRDFFGSLLVLCMSGSNETADIQRTGNNEDSVSFARRSRRFNQLEAFSLLRPKEKYNYSYRTREERTRR